MSQARLSRRALYRLGTFRGGESRPGGRAACWVLTHHMCSPREAELHPPALKWVTGYSHPLQPDCATASAVPAQRDTHHGALTDFSPLEMAGGGTGTLSRHLQRPLSGSLLPLEAPNGPAAVSGSRCSPAGSGRCLSHREAVPPAPGANPAAPAAHRPAHHCRRDPCWITSASRHGSLVSPVIPRDVQGPSSRTRPAAHTRRCGRGCRAPDGTGWQLSCNTMSSLLP